ncbi:hypothetical protein Peur_063852 [Populus x canadensis]
MSDQNNTTPPHDVELKFQLQTMTKMMEIMNFMMGNVCDRLEKVGKHGNMARTYTQDDFGEDVDDIGDSGFKDETIGHWEGFWQPRNQRDFMYFDEVLWQKKMRIQKERWY